MSDSKTPYWIFTAVLILVALLAGYFIGNRGNLNLGSLSNTSSTPAAGSSFFESQTATARGKITAVNGKTITFQGANNQTESFEAADQIYITKMNGNANAATPSSDLRTIELQKDVFINLILGTNGKYQINTITFIPPPPSLPPVAPAATTPQPVSQPTPSPRPAATTAAPAPATSPAASPAAP